MNRLEKLTGSRQGQHSIRINDQWRICFRWSEGDAYEVEIADYHNRKTVTVITDDGQHWNVSPSLLRNAVSENADMTVTKVVPLRKK